MEERKDLISRDFIKSLGGECIAARDSKTHELLPISSIDALPSAHPELITCKDCYWWTKQEDSLQGRCDLMGIYPTGGWYCGNAKR